MQLVKKEREILKDVGRTPEAKVVEDLICYELIEPRLNHFFLVGSNMREWERTKHIEFLKTNIEVFTWTPYKILKIDLSFIKHELNVMPEAHPIK